jgi:hypothetical protein
VWRHLIVNLIKHKSDSLIRKAFMRLCFFALVRCVPGTSRRGGIPVRGAVVVSLLPPEGASSPTDPWLMRKPISLTDRLAQPRRPRRLLRAVPADAAPLAASQTGHACAGWSLPHCSRRVVLAKGAGWGVDGSCKRSPCRRETCIASIDDWVRPEPAGHPAGGGTYYRGCHKLYR